jgi:Fic family protein
MEADVLPDSGENVSVMEPLVLGSASTERPELSDVCLELVRKSGALKSSLPEGVLSALSDLVRSMNCYYSNLIEGHDTHPIDIERALADDYSTDSAKRNLQLEAKAHIEVQRWIDSGAVQGRTLHQATFLEIHKRFCELLPEDLLWVQGNDQRQRIVPGEFRHNFVQVGRHVPISPGAIPRFMNRFESGYGSLGKLESILAMAAVHHRFLWIHPFVDGNGRVARLVSYAQALELLDTGGLWSIARGLARNVDNYKSLLMACDQPRAGDYDGRGNLSESALAELTRFFLEVCLDQVDFMEQLIQPGKLRARILRWVEEESAHERLLASAGRVLEALLYRGELPRAEVPELLGLGDRQSRRVVSALFDRGVLKSKSDRAPLRLAFPATLASSWMPGLFPDKPEK